MRLFLNIFLILFFIDGTVSLAESLLEFFFNTPVLTGIRHLISILTLFISVPLYISTGVNKSIPKKLVYPQIFFLIWVLLSAQPITTLFNETVAGLILSLMQLTISCVIFCFIRLITDSWFMTDRLLQKYTCTSKNTGLFISCNLILGPVITLLYLAASLQLIVFHKTSGFIRLSTDGVYMKEKVYQKDTSIIRLVGMIHIGEESYYTNLMHDFSLQNAILLEEGVSDKDKLLKHHFTTKGLAKKAGLISQEALTIEGNYIDNESFFSSNPPEMKEELTIVNADVDTESFSWDTLFFLNAAAKYLFQPDSFARGLEAYNQWLETYMTDALAENLKTDIIDTRNRSVIRYIERAVTNYDTIIVPWGAMHMPAIEEAVLAMGYRRISSKERLSIKFDFLKLKTLLKKMTVDSKNHKEQTSPVP